jgi:hypothetical protein
VLIGLLKRLEEAEVACATEAGQMAVSVGDISKVLVDLGMPPISRIPQDRAGPATSWRQRALSWNAYMRPTPPVLVPWTR